MPLRQWTLEITKYADQLEAGLEGLDWPEGTLTAQKQWIGRSEGARYDAWFIDWLVDPSLLLMLNTPSKTLYFEVAFNSMCTCLALLLNARRRGF